MTNEDLRRLYLRYNKKYFGGRLGKDVEVAFTKLPLYEYGQSDYFEGEWQKIHINQLYSSHQSFVCMTLLHEMVHTSFKPPYEFHGPRFEKRMLRLAKAGAFKGLW